MGIIEIILIGFIGMNAALGVSSVFTVADPSQRDASLPRPGPET